MNTSTKAEARAKLRGVVVHQLDFTSLEERATAWAHEHHPELVDPDTQRVEVGFAPWGVFEAANGATVLVCVEGVGYLVTDDEATTASVSLYTRGAREGQETIGMMPVLSSTLTLAEVEQHLTGETVDLTEHIRTFGQRLEDNLRTMYRLATDREFADEAYSDAIE